MPLNSNLKYGGFEKEVTKLEGLLKTKMTERGDREWCYNDFELGFQVGKGKFGKVYIARERSSKLIVALKIIKKNDGILHQIVREVNIHSRLRHPNILELYTYFGTAQSIFLVLEFAGLGDLYKILKKQPKGRFREGRVARYIYQISDAINYCHSMSVMHRDIKPENILLDITGSVKMSDFGWSINSPKRRTTLCGTLDYIAPEIVEDHNYNDRLDNWSIGILCYELLTGYPPFQCKTEEETLAKIASIDILYPAIISAPARELISKLLKYNPDERLSLTDVMKHNWVVKYLKTVQCS